MKLTVNDLASLTANFTLTRTDTFLGEAAVYSITLASLQVTSDKYFLISHADGNNFIMEFVEQHSGDPQATYVCLPDGRTGNFNSAPDTLDCLYQEFGLKSPVTIKILKEGEPMPFKQPQEAPQQEQANEVVNVQQGGKSVTQGRTDMIKGLIHQRGQHTYALAQADREIAKILKKLEKAKKEQQDLLAKIDEYDEQIAELLV